jgi:hypothetical protein
MTDGASHDPRFLDGDALRVARVKALEKAFGITLTAEESARCASAEETTAVFTARLGAVPGAGNLRAGALGAVREALREVARADREAIDEATPLVPLFPRWRRARRWQVLGRELHFKLPPVRATWASVAVAAPIVAAHAVFLRGYPSHHFVEEPTMVRLVVLAFGGVLGVLGFSVSLDLPERMTTVEKLVTWLVAQRPAAYRGGTDWTTGQVAEAVDGVHRLRFFRPGCRRGLSRDVLVLLLVLAMIGTTLWLCLLGLASNVVVGPLPPGLR